jgi:Mce-associated membrane protein
MSATDVTAADPADADPADADPTTAGPLAADAPEAPAPVPGDGGSRVARRRRVALVVTAALVVVLAAAAAAFGWKLYEAAALAQDRRAASTAARAAVVDVLSYDYRTLDADLARAQQGLTPGFRQEYARVAAASVRPVAVKQQVVTTASVPAVSVVSATRGSVEVLMFVDQLTTSVEKKNVVNVSRVQVTMIRSGDRWLVSELRAI